MSAAAETDHDRQFDLVVHSARDFVVQADIRPGANHGVSGLGKELRRLGQFQVGVAYCRAFLDMVDVVAPHAERIARQWYGYRRQQGRVRQRYGVQPPAGCAIGQTSHGIEGRVAAANDAQHRRQIDVLARVLGGARDGNDTLSQHQARRGSPVAEKKWPVSCRPVYRGEYASGAAADVPPRRIGPDHGLPIDFANGRRRTSSMESLHCPTYRTRTRASSATPPQAPLLLEQCALNLRAERKMSEGASSSGCCSSTSTIDSRPVMK